MAREFKTGAYRDGEDGKNDYEGFICPLVIKGYGNYMTKHRRQSNGVWRDSDNWQNLFGDDHYKVCMSSAWRHFEDMWLEHRGHKSRDGMEEAINGLLFNIMAYYHKYLLEKEKNENLPKM